jgi:hypothetical protein
MCAYMDAYTVLVIICNRAYILVAGAGKLLNKAVKITNSSIKTQFLHVLIKHF